MKRLLSNRLALYILLIAAELLLLIVAAALLHSFAGLTTFLLLERLLTVILSVIVVNHEANEYCASWLFALWVLPGGWIFYLLLHGKKATLSPHVAATETPEFSDPVLQKAAYLLRTECGYFYADCESVTYYAEGRDYEQALLAALKEAERYIYLEYYIISPGKFRDAVFDILKERAKAGVSVRVIYDDFGSSLLPKKYDASLRSSNIEAFAFHPLRPIPDRNVNHRNHRKLCVIDGKTAFTGGINIADEYINKKLRFGYWKDTGISFTGRAVYNFTDLFLRDWAEYAVTPPPVREDLPKGKEVCIPFGDVPTDGHRACRDLYLTLIHNAKEKLYLFTPYFFPDGRIKTALRTAAKSGIDVRICIPGIPDKKAVYELTLSACMSLRKDGVKIYRYAPGFLHAKMLVCDGKYAVIGTSNLDFRSLYLHYENDVFLYGKSVLPLERDFLNTLRDCDRMGREPVSLWKRLYRSILQVFAPLM